MKFLPVLALGVAALAGNPSARAADAPLQQVESEAAAIAEEAFVYGYPLALMAVTEQQMTTAPASSWFGAPLNRFRHADRTPGPADRIVIRPNTDTLYSSAWLDLSRGPVLLRVPDSGGRYYVLQMMDAWTNVFAAPGTRTTGDGPHTFAIVGPRWEGTLPPGIEPIQAPTNTVWIIGRTLLRGPEDLPAARWFQQQITLTPPFGSTPVTPGLPLRGTPPEVVAAMDGTTFLRLLAARMRFDPPPQRDAPLLAQLARIGFEPGMLFTPRPDVAAILDQAKLRAEARIAATTNRLGEDVNGWRMMVRGIGEYGTNYDERAAVANYGLGANLPADAVYPATSVDRTGQPLDGKNRYVLHFAPGALPPVDAFWSLTLYDADGYLVPNTIARYAIRDRDALRYNEDGSLDLYIQSDWPGEALESNWLPAPADAPFTLLLRLYQPRAEVLSGAWRAPPVERR
ncbi:putative exported protein [Minicystis rosea]|nr:putative exported protein [Minicystis rosea]